MWMLLFDSWIKSNYSASLLLTHIEKFMFKDMRCLIQLTSCKKKQTLERSTSGSEDCLFWHICFIASDNNQESNVPSGQEQWMSLSGW